MMLCILTQQRQDLSGQKGIGLQLSEEERLDYQSHFSLICHRMMRIHCAGYRQLLRLDVRHGSLI